MFICLLITLTIVNFSIANAQAPEILWEKQYDDRCFPSEVDYVYNGNQG